MFDWVSRILVLALLLLLTGAEIIHSNQETSPDSTIFTDQWAVHVPGGDRVADEIAARHGFLNFGKILGDYYHFQHKKVAKRSTRSSPEHHNLLTTDPEIRWAQQQVVKRRVKRDNLVEQSPRHRRSVKSTRPFIFNDLGWVHMWYLNRGNGRDMNVQEAWAEGITGKGSVVTILDDGLEKNHPDIERNYDPRASFDVNDQDEDPSPRYDIKDSNRHGTRCAGEVAAQANNTICAVGVAFDARIGGVRMLDGDVTDAVEARSLSFNSQYIDIYSASWGPDDDGKTVDGPGALATIAFVDGVKKGRNGKGSIFVWASGNGGREHDSCNCDGYTNSIWTLSISSATENGSVPWYSEACSSTLATAYSSGAIGEKQIVTTDLHHSCTPTHTGTSAAAPLAAGICALALEANRNLTWRDMQHIVVRTAKPDHLIAEDWQTNGVGRKVSHSFGYGLMDAAAMVRLARNWKSVPPQQFCEIRASSINSEIPPKQSIKLPLTLVECPTVNVMEHLQVFITLTAMNRGEIEIHLTSPAGTRSTLLFRRPHDTSHNGFHMWPFMSVHFWEESPFGVWNIEVHNHGWFPATLTEWTLVVYGTKERQGRNNLDSETSTTNSSSPKQSVLPQLEKNAQLLQQDKAKVDGDLVLNKVQPSFLNAEKDRGADSLPIPEQLTQPLKLTNAKINQVCEVSYYSWEDECVKTCPNSSYPVNRTELDGSLSGVCAPCHYSCLFCSGPSDSECTSCYPDSQLKLVLTPGSHTKPESHCFPKELVKELKSYENWSIGVELALAVNLALVIALVAYMICKKKSCDPQNHISEPIVHRKGNYSLLTSSSRHNDDNANIPTSVIPGAAIHIN